MLLRHTRATNDDDMIMILPLTPRRAWLTRAPHDAARRPPSMNTPAAPGYMVEGHAIYIAGERGTPAITRQQAKTAMRQERRHMSPLRRSPHMSPRAWLRPLLLSRADAAAGTDLAPARRRRYAWRTASTKSAAGVKRHVAYVERHAAHID